MIRPRPPSFVTPVQQRSQPRTAPPISRRKFPCHGGPRIHHARIHPREDDNRRKFRPGATRNPALKRAWGETREPCCKGVITTVEGGRKAGHGAATAFGPALAFQAACPASVPDRAKHNATHPRRPRRATHPAPAGANPPRQPTIYNINLIAPQSGRRKAKLLNFNEEWLRACIETRFGRPVTSRGFPFGCSQRLVLPKVACPTARHRRRSAGKRRVPAQPAR